MKNEKLTMSKAARLLAMALVLAAAVFALAIACKDDDGGTHTHAWGAWQSDATRHWKECTANDGAKTGEGSHTGNPCAVCGYETPHQPRPATITQATTPALAFAGAVTITTSDLYLDADWNAVVAQVITAFNAAYEAAGIKVAFDFAFGGDGVEVVLVNNLTTNWEVRKTLSDEPGVKGKLYIKIGSINSISTSSYEFALMAVGGNNPATSVTKAKPAKGGVLLGYARVTDTRIL